MARVDTLLECLGRALGEKARRALGGGGRFGEVLPDVAKAALDHARQEFPPDDLPRALAELATLDPGAYAARLEGLADKLGRDEAGLDRDALVAYLAGWPAAVRQVLRRPSDPTGHTPHEGAKFDKPDDLLLFLPARPARLRPDAVPAGLDNWDLTQLRGLGECSEVWAGTDPNHPDAPRAALKFATDPAAAEQVVAQQNLFTAVFPLSNVAGIVPLRTVYLETDPPCLEYGYVSGYDLTALMYEWKWRFPVAKPEAALKLVYRLAQVVGRAHAAKVVHRDLKPSNVLLHPTGGGKFTLWVSDWGWGQIAAARSAELARGGTPRGERHRLALRGASTPLYASPQVTRHDPADPRDDVHALAVLWYQLLKRDPAADPPFGTEWAEEFRPHGFTDSQARLMAACLSTRAEKRPADANALAEQLTRVAVVPSPQDGSKIISLKSGSGEYPAVGPGSGRYPKAGGGPVGTATGHGGLPALMANSVGMTFALVPPGSFQMGSPPGEPGRREHEGPPHPVAITKAFYLGLFPVTQGQYERVMGRNPAHFSKPHGGGPDYPVETVGWHDAEQYCARLNLHPEEELHGRAYRLPTEAEWEYACRAGTTTAFWFGDRVTPKDAHFAAGGPSGKAGGAGKTAPAGSLAANPWGLHDLHGNVQEWVQDWYDEYYYHDAPPADPQGPPHGQVKVTRGGGWAAFGADCRSAARRPHAPDSPSNAIGFRVLMTVPTRAQ